MSNESPTIQRKLVAPVLIAGIRMRGKYTDCGDGFKKLGRKVGRHICGKAMMLCYDDEYRADDADFEVCMPVRRGESSDEISVRELPGGSCLALIHHGPYETLSESYAKILSYAEENGIAFQRPTREVYLKGPGMIFKGNPKKYRTELQLMLSEESDS